MFHWADEDFEFFYDKIPWDCPSNECVFLILCLIPLSVYLPPNLGPRSPLPTVLD